MKRTLRIVNYAVNGSGTGHLTRLVAISRWLRRYSAWAGVRAEIYFLTSSEADGLPLSEQFAAFKLPSKTIVQQAGIDKTTYLALAKQWVWHSLGILRPDLFVVDTFPRGSFGELVNALDLAKQRALVLRPMQAEFARRPDVQAMLPLYDLVLVPEHESDAQMTLPEAARAHTRYVGPIAVRDRAELATRADARQRLGLDQDRPVVYVSAGGGGDAEAERHITRVIGVLLCSNAELSIVAGAGPLYRGQVPRHPRVTWLVNESAAELAAGFDIAVTAAGYNTFVELMLAGVPTVFVPQRKIADDQAARAERAVAAGAASVLEPGASDQSLIEAVAQLLDPRVHQRASLAARALVPRSCARTAAAELLRLQLSASEVDRAEVAVGDALLQATRDLDVSCETLIELMHLLDADGGHGSPQSELLDLQRRATALLRRAGDAGIDPAALNELSCALLRRSTLRDAAAREALICEGMQRFTTPDGDQPEERPQ